MPFGILIRFTKVCSDVRCHGSGSGSSANLEMVLQYYNIFSAKVGRRSDEVVNRVRFLFFGAEEAGLLGSFAYVAALNATNAVDHNLDRIVSMFDFDMFGEAERLLLMMILLQTHHHYTLLY